MWTHRSFRLQAKVCQSKSTRSMVAMCQSWSLAICPSVFSTKMADYHIFFCEIPCFWWFWPTILEVEWWWWWWWSSSSSWSCSHVFLSNWHVTFFPINIPFWVRDPLCFRSNPPSCWYSCVLYSSPNMWKHCESITVKTKHIGNIYYICICICIYIYISVCVHVCGNIQASAIGSWSPLKSHEMSITLWYLTVCYWTWP